MNDDGSAMRYNRPQARQPKDNLIHYLNADSSVDTIFYAVWAGAMTYAFARQGMEFSKATSIGIALVVGTCKFLMFEKLAVQLAGQMTQGFGTVIRQPVQYN